EVAARRAALQTLNTSLNLGFPDVSAPANLSNEEYAVIEADVLAKRTSLTNAKTIIDAINANLTMSNDKKANADTLKILKGIGTAPDMNDVRRRLNEAKSILGNVDLSPALRPENLLSDADAGTIKKRAFEKYNFFRIVEAIKKTDQPQLLELLARAGDEAQILAEINRQRASWGFARAFVRNDDLSDSDLIEIKRQAGLKLAAINTKPNMADSLWQTGKDFRLEHFTDTLKRHDGTVSAPAPSIAVPGAVALSVANPIETRYQGVKLQQGDKIESVANFPAKPRGRNPLQDSATGKLVQDHTGKVTDITDAAERDKMTEQEKSQMAIKQAKMLITNLKGTGEQTVFITGDDQHHADRVYAALLLMKNDLKFKIESHVPGCEGPRKRAGFELQSTVDDKFIKDKLRGYNDKALEGFKTEAKDFIANTKKSREQMSLMRGGQAGSSTDALKVDEHLTASGKKI
ncbi:hypothetical protein, partial [Legionella qingyii]|uniref:hypothetical protein n=1 Tax=Legionella qingyii TaxID=2184757 RepID=UPI0013154492